MEPAEVQAGLTLGQALKAASLVGTGGEAKILIQAGDVLVNGEVEVRRGRRLASGDVVEILLEDEVVTERLEVR